MSRAVPAFAGEIRFLPRGSRGSLPISPLRPPVSDPVKLAADAAEAEDWANAENAAREDMTPADEIRAFGRMKSRGATVPEIALAFAVTEARVYQRLALAGLPEPVLDALAAGEISLGTAKAFTLSDDEALTLSLLDQVKGQAVSESAIKKAQHPDAIKANCRPNCRPSVSYASA